MTIQELVIKYPGIKADIIKLIFKAGQTSTTEKKLEGDDLKYYSPFF